MKAIVLFFLSSSLIIAQSNESDYEIVVYSEFKLAEIAFGVDKYYSYPIITSNVTGKVSGIYGPVNITNVHGGIVIG